MWLGKVIHTLTNLISLRHRKRLVLSGKGSSKKVVESLRLSYVFSRSVMSSCALSNKAYALGQIVEKNYSNRVNLVRFI